MKPFKINAPMKFPVPKLKRIDTQISDRFSKTEVSVLPVVKPVESADVVFVISVYKDHISLQNQEISIPMHPSIQKLIFCIEHNILPIELESLLVDSDVQFVDGGIWIELYDYRANTVSPFSRRVFLKSSGMNLYQELSSLSETDLSYDDLIACESKILLAKHQVLALEPDDSIMMYFNQFCYKKHLMSTLKDSRENDWKPHKKEPISNPNNFDTTKPQEPFMPRFKQLQAIEDYKRQKSLLDADISVGLDKKGRKPGPFISTFVGDDKKVVRTVRFEKEMEDEYTCMNVYANEQKEFQAVIRVGTEPDSSINGFIRKGPVCDAHTMEIYVQTFKVLISAFESNAKLVSDMTTGVLGNSSLARHSSKINPIKSNDNMPKPNYPSLQQQSAQNIQAQATNKAIQAAMTGIINSNRPASQPVRPATSFQRPNLNFGAPLIRANSNGSFVPAANQYQILMMQKQQQQRMQQQSQMANNGNAYEENVLNSLLNGGPTISQPQPQTRTLQHSKTEEPDPDAILASLLGGSVQNDPPKQSTPLMVPPGQTSIASTPDMYQQLMKQRYLQQMQQQAILQQQQAIQMQQQMAAQSLPMNAGQQIRSPAFAMSPNMLQGMSALQSNSPLMVNPNLNMVPQKKKSSNPSTPSAKRVREDMNDSNFKFFQDFYRSMQNGSAYYNPTKKHQ
ncbi:hypothetical protein O9G_004773 [Rozella allomycis CSF55]|uniref:Spt20-like SEP domain-containing protein n=1 Tax=Rozella allomycis (strain CSF55) TaxID=988480 RepID=A0A075ARL8_ROZAC|nr:hypothetical protein O9G_004773 [Rozella allomycis CSF55]|eukprot:EPZ32888.1 hypothetical protein O9G_004773 [Rozella allomycis CSF55]